MALFANHFRRAVQVDVIILVVLLSFFVARHHFDVQNADFGAPKIDQLELLFNFDHKRERLQVHMATADQRFRIWVFQKWVTLLKSTQRYCTQRCYITLCAT